MSGDHLGSTSLTTDQNGTVVSEVRYLPYGEERWTNGSTPTDFTFTGQRAEAGFGLMDYNARYYSPRLGRFVSPDSIVPDPSSSSGFNRYRYTRNNPLKYIDPSGHEPCSSGNWGDCPPPKPTPPDAEGDYVSDLVQEYDPNYGNLYYNDPNYANDPTVHSNYSLWRSMPGCSKCHITHDTGRIPTNGELDDYPIEFGHSWDEFGEFVKLTGVGLHASQTQLANNLAENGINEVPASTPVGRKGNPIQVAPNQGTEIGGRYYSGHALDRMQGRGFVPSVVEDTVSVGSATPGKYPGTTTHYSPENNITVVLNNKGDVVTVFFGGK